jgi:hypothetical protein
MYGSGQENTVEHLKSHLRVELDWGLETNLNTIAFVTNTVAKYVYNYLLKSRSNKLEEEFIAALYAYESSAKALKLPMDSCDSNTKNNRLTKIFFKKEMEFYQSMALPCLLVYGATAIINGEVTYLGYVSKVSVVKSTLDLKKKLDLKSTWVENGIEVNEFEESNSKFTFASKSISKDNKRLFVDSF